MSTWLVLGIVAAAVGSIIARRLVVRVLWLAATSVLLAMLLALLGAPIVAVIEVSVGAGLVAVLFVFTVGIAGEDGLRGHPFVPRPVALGLAGSAVLLLLWLLLPVIPSTSPAAGAGQAGAALRGLADVLWQDRAADLLGQAVMIVVAALAVRTILGSSRATPTAPARAHGDRRAPPAETPVPVRTTTVAVAIPITQATGEPAAPVGAARGTAVVREEARP